ncbi:hypothetical protein ON010_g1637 [Phytophthora cinnamomi]|nr:hypothetical protein ON010_g1637 [Phytophthora cinnamomi]
MAIPSKNVPPGLDLVHRRLHLHELGRLGHLVLVEQRLDVLEHDALGLRTEEVHEHQADQTQACKQEEHAVDVERGEELDYLRHDSTHGPVGRRRQSDTRCTHVEREDLGRVDPAHGAPRDGEVEHEEGRAHADEPAAHRRTPGVVDVAAANGREQNCGPQVPDDHTHAADQQQRAAAVGVHPAHGRNGADEVDPGDEKRRVAPRVGDVLEDERAVAHDGVDARGLLQHLQHHGDDHALADARLEDLQQSLAAGLLLGDLVADHLQLVAHVVGLSEALEHLLGRLLALVLVRPARTLRYEPDAQQHHDGWRHGDAVGRAPAAVVVVHDDVDNVGQKEPDDHGHLHEARQHAAQLLGGHLGAEQRQREGRVADAEALDDTRDVHERVRLRLVEADPARAAAEEQAGAEDGGAAAELVGDEASDEGAHEAAQVVRHVVPDREGGPLRRQVRCGARAVLVREVVPADAVVVEEGVHDEHGRRHALVIAEEHAAERGEDAHDDGIGARALGRRVVEVGLLRAHDGPARHGSEAANARRSVQACGGPGHPLPLAACEEKCRVSTSGDQRHTARLKRGDESSLAPGQ